MRKHLGIIAVTAGSGLLSLALGQSLQSTVLSPELLLSKVLKSSARVKSIREVASTAQAEEFAARSALDPRIEARSVWTKDDREPSSPFALSNSKIFTAEVSAAKYFSTGSLLSAKLSHTRFQASTGGAVATEINNQEPYVEVAVAQNLLKDAFGRDTRLAIEAGALLTEVRKIDSQSQLEDWALNLVSTYLEARALQQVLLLLDENVKSRERLDNIALSRSRRGTLERKDLKKIQSSLINIQLKRQETENKLRNLLFLLATVAELPREVLAIDVRKITLAPGFLSNEPCAPAYANSSEFTSKEVRKAQSLAEAARLRAKAVAHADLPEVQIFGSVGANAVDDSAARSWRQLQRDPGPVWTVGVQARWNWDNSGTKSQQLTSRLQAVQAEANSQDAKDSFLVQKDDICRSIAFYRSEVEQRRRASEGLSSAAKLYDQDFLIGRSSAFDIVQATEEVITERQAYAQAEKNYLYSQWKLLKLQDRLIAYLDTLEMKTP